MDMLPVRSLRINRNTGEWVDYRIMTRTLAHNFEWLSDETYIYITVSLNGAWNYKDFDIKENNS